MPNLYITTRADVKTYMGISGTTYDTVIDALVERVDAMARTYTNRKDGFVQAAQTETLSGTQGASLTLTYTPILVSAGVSIVMDGNSVDSSLYTFDPDSGIVKFTTDSQYYGGYMFAQPGMQRPYQRSKAPAWSSGFRNIVLTYTGGYIAVGGTATGGIDVMPPDLQQAGIDMVKVLMDSRLRNGTVASEKLGAHEFTNFTPNTVRDALNSIMQNQLAEYVRNPFLSMGV